MKSFIDILSKIYAWYKTKSRGVKIVIWCLILYIIGTMAGWDKRNYGYSSSSSSGGTYSTKAKTCGYCGNKFTGKGWYHIGNACEQENGNGWDGTHCSNKCCSEDWAHNGIYGK